LVTISSWEEKEMQKAKFVGAIVIVGGLLASSVASFGQTQNQSVWQRIKNSAKQAGQNTAQQGTQQVQQGVQQGTSAVSGQVNGGQQTPCGSLSSAGTGGGATLTNAAFSGAGGNVSTGSCGQNCFNAGPFAAAVSQMTMSQQGYWHIIRMEVQFHNGTNQPIALAYHDGSMEMVDELGNAYQGAGGNPGELQGMGIDRGSQTDSQFILAPGQTSSAIFSVARMRNNTQPIGTSFTYNLTIDQLQAQNGASAIVARQYNLNFPNMAPGSSGGAFPASTPASGFAAGSGNSNGVANYTGAGAPAANSQTAVPAQRNAVNARSAVATTNAPRGAAAAQGAVSNAALRSSAATAAKPAAAKPAPAKTAVKKTTDNTTQTK
jgi:hypothetical protein